MTLSILTTILFNTAAGAAGFAFGWWLGSLLGDS